MNNSLFNTLHPTTIGGDIHPFTVYFAGGLFNHKELFGNATLARYIDKVSQGRYHCILPQDLESTVERAAEVRNLDLLHVMSCDMAVFNFDGAELDSGTVVEMIFSKMLDIPAVVLRTDFRLGGDGFKDGDPWNLMCSTYPRNKVVHIHGMAWYQESLKAGGTPQEMEERYYTRIAETVIANLDAARAEKSWLTETVNLYELFRCAVRFPGAGLEKTPNSLLRSLIRRKIGKGLLPDVPDGVMPRKALQLHSTFLELQNLAHEIRDEATNDSQVILTLARIEQCHALVRGVLDLDTLVGDSVDLHQQIFSDRQNSADAQGMLQAVEVTIKKQAAELQGKAEILYREAAYHSRAVYQQAHVVVQESLLRTFTLEVQRVADAIAKVAMQPKA